MVCVIVLFVICEWSVGWLCECMLKVFGVSFVSLNVFNSSTLLNTFFFLFSIVIDDTDDKGLCVLIYIGNVLLIVGKGGNSFSYIYFVFIWLFSSNVDIFIYCTSLLFFSSTESKSLTPLSIESATPTLAQSFTPSTSHSQTYRPISNDTYKWPTLFLTKTSILAYMPTPYPTTIPRCEKDYGKKFEYLGDKYSCKQLKKSKNNPRKRICMRVKRARNLCPVICKYKM